MAVNTGGKPKQPTNGLPDGFTAPPVRKTNGPGAKPARWGLHQPPAPETFPPTQEGRDIVQEALNITPPPSAATEIPAPDPDPINPEPTPDPLQEDEDGYITVRMPKAALTQLIQEIIMSQNNKNPQNANANNDAAADANANQTQAGATAQPEQVQAKVEVKSDGVAVDLNTGAPTQQQTSKKKTWAQIGTHVGAVILGAGLTVGVQLLAKRYNLPVIATEGGEVEA